MSVQLGRVTVEQFEQLVALLENSQRRLEYIGGEAVEVVSNNYSSLVAARILARLVLYVEDHALGYVTGADGGYNVAGERYIPDVAFISVQKQPTPPHDTWNVHAPDLAVEVLSPTDDPEALRVKLVNYLGAGTVVWIVNPERRRVEVYAPGQPVHRLDVNGTLSGGTLLPGFALAVAALFPEVV